MIDGIGSQVNPSVLFARIKASPRAASWVLLLLLGSLAIQWQAHELLNLQLYWLLVLLCLGYGLYWPMLQSLLLGMALPTAIGFLFLHWGVMAPDKIALPHFLQLLSIGMLALAGLCLCGLVGLYVWAMAAPTRYQPKLSIFLFQVVVVVLAMAFFWRWYLLAMIAPSQGYSPLLQPQEHLLFVLASVCLLYLYFDKHAFHQRVGLWLAGAALLALLYFLIRHVELQVVNAATLPWAAYSPWKYLQVGLCQFALAAFVLATCCALSQLSIRTDSDEGFRRIQLLSDITYRSVALGFTVHSVGLFVTLLWSSHVFGVYWAWLPDQVGLLVVWFNYAAWLHMHLSKGWRGTPMLIWLLLSMGLTWVASVGAITHSSVVEPYLKPIIP